MSRIRFRAVLALAGALWLVPAAGARAVDWSGFADVDTIEVITADEDGGERRTTVWLLVLEGEAYVRTSDTRWGDNAVRDPEFEVEIAGATFPVSGSLVTDPALRERVTLGFREKYGFMDRVTDWIRSSHPRIFRLTSR